MHLAKSGGLGFGRQVVHDLAHLRNALRDYATSIASQTGCQQAAGGGVSFLERYAGFRRCGGVGVSL